MNQEIVKTIEELFEEVVDNVEVPAWEHIYDRIQENKEIIKTISFISSIAYLAYNVYTLSNNQKFLENTLEGTIERIKEIDLENKSIKMFIKNRHRVNKIPKFNKPRKFTNRKCDYTN